MDFLWIHMQYEIGSNEEMFYVFVEGDWYREVKELIVTINENQVEHVCLSLFLFNSHFLGKDL